MAVITSDILLEGVPRDTAFAWLSEAANVRKLLDGAFDGVRDEGPTQWSVDLKVQPKARQMGLRFLGPDASHGGRRVLLDATGKRTEGKVNFSLRTMKPSANTLVTVHMDYEPGAFLGALIDRAGLQDRLDKGWKATLENLGRLIPRS